MNRYLLLHVGFEKPTPEIMGKWNAWFEATKDRTTDSGGFAAGREITADGTAELPWGPDCLTGYSIIEAGSLDEAEAVARDNPFITAIRVYELRSK